MRDVITNYDNLFAIIKRNNNLEIFKSQYHNILCGIPQGPVMGHLLFNIVINNLPSATNKFDFIMYADDTTLVSTLENFRRTRNVKEIERNINIEISKFTTWL